MRLPHAGGDLDLVEDVVGPADEPRGFLVHAGNVLGEGRIAETVVGQHLGGNDELPEFVVVGAGDDLKRAGKARFETQLIGELIALHPVRRRRGAVHACDARGHRRPAIAADRDQFAAVLSIARIAMEIARRFDERAEGRGIFDREVAKLPDVRIAFPIVQRPHLGQVLSVVVGQRKAVVALILVHEHGRYGERIERRRTISEREGRAGLDIVAEMIHGLPRLACRHGQSGPGTARPRRRRRDAILCGEDAGVVGAVAAHEQGHLIVDQGQVVVRGYHVSGAAAVDLIPLNVGRSERSSEIGLPGDETHGSAHGR